MTWSLRAALLAGLVAVLVNTLLLDLARLIPLEVQGVALLKLLKLGLGDALARTSLAEAWNRLHLPAPDSAIFKAVFHIAVGLAMAVVYALLVEPLLRGPAWSKGLLYALLAWLLNAFALLPAIGEGVAGHDKVSLAGIVYYAVAHMVFFVLMAMLYARFRRDQPIDASTP